MVSTITVGAPPRGWGRRSTNWGECEKLREKLGGYPCRYTVRALDLMDTGGMSEHIALLTALAQAQEEFGSLYYRFRELVHEGHSYPAAEAIAVAEADGWEEDEKLEDTFGICTCGGTLIETGWDVLTGLSVGHCDVCLMPAEEVGIYGPDERDPIGPEVGPL